MFFQRKTQHNINDKIPSQYEDCLDIIEKKNVNTLGWFIKYKII